MNHVLYMTWKTLDLTKEDKGRVQSWKELNPDYRIVILDDKMMYDWMEINTSQKLVECLKQVKCGAAKADIFRYAVLYKNGGAYVDIDCRCVKPFALKDLEKYSLVTCVDVFPRLIFQGFLFANKQYHPYFMDCLTKIVENMDQNLHQYDVFSFSGPLLAAKCMYKYIYPRNERRYFSEGYYKEHNILLLSHKRSNENDWIEYNGEKIMVCQEIVKDKRISGDYGIIWDKAKN